MTSLGGVLIGALANAVGVPFAVAAGCVCTILTTAIGALRAPEIAAFDRAKRHDPAAPAAH